MNQDLPEGVTRETMDVDVLIVGGGSAGLACALQLSKLLKARNEGIAGGTQTGEAIVDPMIVVLEKGPEVGAHSFSGAVLKPTALAELMPDYREQGCPIDSDVKTDAVYYLGSDFAFKMPITPPPFRNHGNHIVSISKFNRWLGQKCEEQGINIFPSFAAVEALYEGDRIVGVRTGDKGRDKNGAPKSNFEPGMILKAKVVVFAEGTRGSLFKQVSKRLNLRDGKNAEVFEEGVKEIIQMPPGTVEAGQVIHTLGFPLKKSIGGTFIYTIPGDKIIVGLVAYLDSKDPLLDPHRELQKLKTHPFVQKMIKGGKVIAYGGKTLPAGGYYSMPKLAGDGWMVCGDSASMVDVQKLKGIHLAMKSGMLAAQTALDVLVTGDSTVAITGAYEKAVHESFVGGELRRVRNFHQTLSKGIIASMPLLALQEVTAGRGLFDHMRVERDSKETLPYLDVWGPQPFEQDENKLPTPDGVLFFDKLSSVYLTGTMHDEDSPNHLIVPDKDICRTICKPQYESPCVLFCPANVYEMLPVPAKPGQDTVANPGQNTVAKPGQDTVAKPAEYNLQVNFTNCIHCKTCDIKCPFENIEWTVPEGGGGPRYQET